MASTRSSAPARRAFRLEALEERVTPIVGPDFTPLPMDAAHWLGTGVVRISTPNGGGTGTLLWTGRHILTAAHILDIQDTNGDGRIDGRDNGNGAPDTGLYAVTFELPEGGLTTMTLNHTTAAPRVFVPAGWNGNARNNGSDIAVIELPRVAPASAARHHIYRGRDEVDRWFYVVGYGMTGTATNPAGQFTDGQKRWGTNFWDDTDDRGNSPDDSLLESDFDEDTDDWSSGGPEVMTHSGDSGGPSFLWGPTGLEVAAVTSFGDAVVDFGSDAWDTRVSSFTGFVDGAAARAADIRLDMADHAAGRDGAADTVRIDNLLGTVRIFINDQLVHQQARGQINSIRLTGGSAQDTFIVSPMGLPVVDVFGASNDVLQVRGHEAADRVTMTFGQVELNSGVVRWNGVGSVNLNTFGGIDTINVQQVSAGLSSVVIEAGAGTDTINVGNAGQSLADIRSPVTIHGQGEADTLNFNDQGVTTTQTYATSTPPTDGTIATLERSGASAVTFTSADIVTLNAGQGDDTINIRRTLHASQTTVNAGAGSDTVNVGDTDLMFWIRTLTINGQAGSNNRVFFRNVDQSGRIYTLTTNGLQLATLQGVLHEPITYTGFNLMSLTAGSGNDRFVMSSRPAPFLASVEGGTGSDSLTSPSTGVNTWTKSILNAGGLNGMGFTNIESLIGASNADTLSYAPYASTRPVTVNLATGVVTDQTNAVSGFENATGGNGNDNLTGNSSSNILVGHNGLDTINGGSGRDVIIGGAGVDTLNGEGGEDIVIGMQTGFDLNAAALEQVRAEWNSSRTYAQRVQNLTGVSLNNPTFAMRLNGSTYLRPNYVPRNAFLNATVFNDNLRDVLTGGADNDWFFAFVDTLADRQTSEQVH